MYLSNNRPGRPSSTLYDFKRAGLADRRQIALKTRDLDLVVWQLHDCAAAAPHDPQTTLPYAVLALEIAESFDNPDLLSWAYSELGNIHRLLSLESAQAHLDEAVRLAVNPYQQADAIRQKGIYFLLGRGDLTAAFSNLDQAYEISKAAEPRIYSDRGHPMVLQSKALAHLYHAALHDESHLEIAVPLLETVLEIGCPRNARRARLSALRNLVAIPLTHGFPVERHLVVQLTDAYNALPQKSSLLGAQIRWVLLRAEIREHGYTEARRRRLLTARSHLLEKQAWCKAALLTLDIAVDDVVSGSRRRALQLLESSRSVFQQAGLAEVARTLLTTRLTEESLASARAETLIRKMTGKRRPVCQAPRL